MELTYGHIVCIILYIFYSIYCVCKLLYQQREHDTPLDIFTICLWIVITFFVAMFGISYLFTIPI